MKVGDSGESNAQRASLQLLQEDGVVRKNPRTAEGGLVEALQRDAVSIGTQTSLLDPELLAAERKARVEAIKKQVQDGTYQIPSSTDLAKKFIEELSYDVDTLKAGNDE